MPAIQPPSLLAIVDRLKRRQNYVGSTEVMNIFGVSRKTLCQWIRNGTLPAFKIGKNYVCAPVLLAAWIEERSTV